MVYRVGAVGLAVLGASLGTPAAAQLAPGWYLGGNIGRTYGHFDNGAAVAVPPDEVTSITGDKHETAWKLFGGYQFQRYFATEFGYYDLGRYNFGYTATTGTFNANSRIQGLNLDLVGTLPFGYGFTGLARIGAAWTRARTDVSTTGGIPDFGGSHSRRDWGPKVGLGLEYAITPNWAVRGEWERYRITEPVRGRSNLDMASIGIVYRFGSYAAQ